MRDLMDSQSDNGIISPTAFIVGLDHPHHPQDLQFQDDDSYLPELIADKTSRLSVQQGTKGSEKELKKKLAGVKSRQKKKRYLDELQESVKKSQSQIEKYDLQISKCKDQLVEAIKTSTYNTSQHAHTNSQLQKLANSEDPDLDRLNLLLDLIQNRIGAKGKERQSKLQYNFKQIINSLFPASHRYCMHTALYELDCYQENATPEKLCSQQTNSWTRLFYVDLNLSQAQIDKFAEKKGQFLKKRRQTVNLIKELKSFKQQLMSQEDIFENAMNHFRQEMSTVQSAQFILFGQKNKYRHQFSLLGQLFQQQQQIKPSKKVKTH